MPAVALQERLKAILKADSRDIEIDEDMLRSITPDLLEGAPPDLANAADQERLQQIIDEFDPRLIIVDNISTLVRSGGAENDAEGWIPVQSWGLKMRREGRAVLFVHHTGKGGKQRGTSKREDVLDAVISLRRPEPYDPADGAQFIVEFEKARHLKGDKAKAFEAKLGTDSKERQEWTTTDIEQSTVDRVVALYREGVTKVYELAEELGVNKSAASRALRKARAAGLISDTEAP
jgi:ribosomal protein S25